MIEYFVTYDVASGAINYKSSGPVGAAAQQQPPSTMAVLSMPYAAFIALPGGGLPTADQLAPLKSMASDQIDIAAGKFRSQFITTVPGQAETYLYKANEARAWTADNTAPTPLMTPEATARGITIAALAAEVLSNEAAWLTLGGKIEGARMGAKSGVSAATTISAIVAAADVNWATLLTS